MKREIIESVFDEVIDNFNVKCSPSKSPSVTGGFGEHAEKFGLKVLKPDHSGSAFTLYDEKNDVYLDFSNAFINQNIIDVNNNGEKSINLEDIFKGYDSLPVKVKKRMGLIKFHHFIEGENGVNKGTRAWSTFIDADAGMVNTITIPDYFFTKYNSGDGNYERVLAHEAMHNYDYKKPTKNTLGLLDDFFHHKNMDWQDRVKLFNNYIQATGKNKFTKTYGFYDKAKSANEDYLKKNGSNNSQSVNRSSDYGGTLPYEDFAEAGSMVLVGLHNPDNPNATVLFNGRSMQFREWVTVHPYQTQALAKELFGEDLSVDDVLGMGVSTPLVPSS